MLKNNLVFWRNRQLPLWLWAFLIYLGSSLPSAKASDNQILDFLFHKAVHLLEYSVLYLLYYRSLTMDYFEFEHRNLIKSLLFVLVFGVFDEYHQSFIPGRNGRYQDILVDFLGGLLGLVLWLFLRRRKHPELEI